MEASFVHDKKGMELDVSPNHSAMKSRRKTENLAASGSDGKLGDWELVQEIFCFLNGRGRSEKAKGRVSEVNQGLRMC